MADITLDEYAIHVGYAICHEFGPQFNGIRDRLDVALWALKHGTREEWSNASIEVLHSVHPDVARRLLPTYRSPLEQTLDRNAAVKAAVCKGNEGHLQWNT
jgi:hypothetical protein